MLACFQNFALNFTKALEYAAISGNKETIALFTVLKLKECFSNVACRHL